MSDSLNAYLILAGILFAIGTFGFLARRRARRGQGADEHESERTPRCVSERAQEATRPSAVRWCAVLAAS